MLVFHVASITNALTGDFGGDLLGILGDLGLVLFFVISGFLLYRPFVAARLQERPAPHVARYARRRVLRIVPGYWAAISLLAIFPGIVGPFSPDWWRYYLFAQLYSGRTVGAGIPVAWTLCVEVSFYVLLPLWAALIGRLASGHARAGLLRSELAALTTLAAVGIVTQVAASRLLISRLVADSLLGQSTWFALGMALAVVSVAHAEGWRWRTLDAAHSRPVLCWAGAAAALVGLALVLHPGGGFAILLALTTRQPVLKTVGGITLTAALMVLLVVPAVFDASPARTGGFPARILTSRPLAGLGLISYGVYLYHLPIAELLGFRTSLQYTAHGLDLVHKVHSATTLVLLAATLAASCVVAAVSYRLIELPFLRRKEVPVST